MLAGMEELNVEEFSCDDSSKLLLIAEGFEPRSLTFANLCKDNEVVFDKTIVFDNRPVRKSRKEELIELLNPISLSMDEFEFHRFLPASHENELFEILQSSLDGIDEVVIDVSVMSKILIISLIYILKEYDGNVTIIYTEPKDYAPSEEEFAKIEKIGPSLGSLPSVGVYDVVRTPMLTSSVMQDKPSVVVCFTSFNERLVRSLLAALSPGRLLLIASVPPRLAWHTEATMKLHGEIIEEYSRDNKLSETNNFLNRRASTLDYRETFDILKNIYREYCYTNRIVIAPTGSKMQAVASGLIKACCPDIHIEYPTPESFLVDGYSTSEIQEIYKLKFDKFKSMLEAMGDFFKLDG